MLIANEESFYSICYIFMKKSTSTSTDAPTSTEMPTTKMPSAFVVITTQRNTKTMTSQLHLYIVSLKLPTHVFICVIIYTKMVWSVIF